MSPVVGIDIAKHSFDVATLQPNGKYRTRAKLTNKAEGFQALQAWLTLHAEPAAWVLMEATGIYHQALAEYLHAQGYRVCMINPARISSYAKSQLRRVKTDKTDAKLIALYGQRHVDVVV